MSKDELDAIAWCAITRCMAAAGDICEQFKHRFPNEEPLIEELHQRQREAMTMLIATPDVRTSGR